MTTTKEAIAESVKLVKDLMPLAADYWPGQESRFSRTDFNDSFEFIIDGLLLQSEHLENSSAALVELAEKLKADLEDKPEI